jgi:hypothetical protein
LEEVLEALGISGNERDRIASMIGSGNARRVYRIPAR